MSSKVVFSLLGLLLTTAAWATEPPPESRAGAAQLEADLAEKIKLLAVAAEEAAQLRMEIEERDTRIAELEAEIAAAKEPAEQEVDVEALQQVNYPS